MNIIEVRKCLSDQYLKSAIKLYNKNLKVDDYDIRISTGQKFEEISTQKMALLELAKDICGNHSRGGSRKLPNHFKELFFNSTKSPLIITKQMTFSGTIGINDIKKDNGLDKHLCYLRIFFEKSDLHKFNDVEILGNSENEIMNSYIEFYKKLVDLLQSSPIYIYKLFSGLKREYKIPDYCALINENSYKIINFSKLNDSRFLNLFSNFSFSLSDTSPYLKISFEGNKLMHIRTKIEQKNKKFKLRFFIETTSKFFDLFEEDYIV